MFISEVFLDVLGAAASVSSTEARNPKKNQELCFKCGSI